MTACLFCRIAAGEIPASIVYQDDRIVAFKDINPHAPGHVLVIPRRHVATINDLSAEDDGLVGEMVRRTGALAGELGFSERGYRTVFNCNADAGQTVFHIHLHLLGGRRFVASGVSSAELQLVNGRGTAKSQSRPSLSTTPNDLETCGGKNYDGAGTSDDQPPQRLHRRKLRIDRQRGAAFVMWDIKIGIIVC